MNKLIKYLKKSTLPIIFIVALLVGQAICELALPDYTSNIVNVGIQQGGVENAVPKIIRKSELDKTMKCMQQIVTMIHECVDSDEEKTMIKTHIRDMFNMYQ